MGHLQKERHSLVAGGDTTAKDLNSFQQQQHATVQVWTLVCLYNL
jgi:hypothetical protein